MPSSTRSDAYVSCANEYGRLRRVALCSSAHAFRGVEQIAREWKLLNFTAPPDLALAQRQDEALRALLAEQDVEIVECPGGEGVTLDGIYLRDAAIFTPRGVVLCRMGKAARAAEPAAVGKFFTAIGLPVIGSIDSPGVLEGGDVMWFDERTVAVGQGYRTNEPGIAQLRALLGRDVEVIVVPLPHFRGPLDVFHLMSILSPIDRDLAVAYSPLMPVPFREWLLARSIRLVEVPDEEFDAMAGNVLALAPRRCLMLEGNPVTRARLETAGAHVLTYDGSEISVKGGGGPTCLTRPLVRDT